MLILTNDDHDLGLLFGGIVPSHGDLMLALINVIPAWRYRAHIGGDVAKLSVLVHCRLQLLPKVALHHLAVGEFALQIVAHQASGVLVG